MLELVGIGVFGACLSALLCIITEGTPYEVPKVISFRQGLLKPRIIRPANWPQWKSGVIEKEKEIRRMHRQKIDESIETDPQKLRSKVGPNYRHFGTSVRNFERYSRTMATKAVDNVKEYWKDNHQSVAASCAARKKCKHRGNIQNSKHPETMARKDSKKRLTIKKSLSRIKTAFVAAKKDESCAETNESRNNWTKIRTKKRRFILPKNLIVAKKPNGTNEDETAETDPFEDSIDRILLSNGRYCYLEALRIKTNKVEKIV